MIGLRGRWGRIGRVGSDLISSDFGSRCILKARLFPLPVGTQ